MRCHQVERTLRHCAVLTTDVGRGVCAVHEGLLYSHQILCCVLSYYPKQLLFCSIVPQLVNWLGLDPSLTNLDGLNLTKLHERSYPPALLSPALLQELVAFFQPHNQQLFTLLESRGYGGLVLQLKKAWDIELHETMRTLQRTLLDQSPVEAAIEEAELP